MAIAIVAFLILGLFIIATEKVNRMNKAAVAMFVGVLCWILYLSNGALFVINEHPVDFLSYISNDNLSSTSVKEFIATSVFLKYIVSSAEIVLFLLGTMTIIEVLDNNGCFDFISEWLRTKSPQRYMWLLAGITFIISANLNNISTICMMLSIMHTMISSHRLRMIYGAVIVIAANCGGAFTVIGDITSLSLWVNKLVTPTAYSSALILPTLGMLITSLFLISRKLPSRLEMTRMVLPYRGDDTILTRWQRLLLLFVGIGGLWFIPTFHRITELPPFVGSLCVLSLMWIVNELCNRSLLGSDQMVRKRMPIALQYANIQNMLYFIGIILALGAVKETGILENLYAWIITNLENGYCIGILIGGLSAIFNNVTMVLSGISVFSDQHLVNNISMLSTPNGYFWPLLSYTTAMGGTLLIIGTMGGFLLMRMEEVTLKWYIRHISAKVLAGMLVGLLIFYLIQEFLF